MASYTYEEKAGLRQQALTLIDEVTNSQSLEELAEHFEYGSGMLADMPGTGACTEEEATGWQSQLHQAKHQATERLENLP